MNDGFRLGKYYCHKTGRRIHVVGTVKTMVDWVYVAEERGRVNLLPLGMDPDQAHLWAEISKDEFLSFKKNDPLAIMLDEK